MVLNVKGAKILFKKGTTQNTIHFLVNEKDYGNAIITSPNFGNFWYLQFKNNPDSFFSIYDSFFLDLAAFNNDFDSYSDMYKDIHNVRPHYTIEEWKLRVTAAQNRKP